MVMFHSYSLIHVEEDPTSKIIITKFFLRNFIVFCSQAFEEISVCKNCLCKNTSKCEVSTINKNSPCNIPV